jgi:hypothetical protein
MFVDRIIVRRNKSHTNGYGIQRLFVGEVRHINKYVININNVYHVRVSHADAG